jgi:hypothetical protein
MARMLGFALNRPQLGVLSVSVLAPAARILGPARMPPAAQLGATRQEAGLLVLNAGPGLFLPALSIAPMASP